MSKHIIDRSASESPSRMQRFLMLERQDWLHPVTWTLIRKRPSESAARLKSFLALARRRAEAA